MSEWKNQVKPVPAIEDWRLEISRTNWVSVSRKSGSGKWWLYVTVSGGRLFDGDREDLPFREALIHAESVLMKHLAAVRTELAKDLPEIADQDSAPPSGD